MCEVPMYPVVSAREDADFALGVLRVYRGNSHTVYKKTHPPRTLP